MTAVALARALAQDARVVLVDLALERPKLASITHDPRAPGIADLVRGTASFGQIITRDRFSRVQVVAGRPGRDRGRDDLHVRAAEHRDRRAVAHPTIMSSSMRVRRRYVPADRIARLAPCGVLVAGNVTEEAANATRDHLANAGFSDIALFTGTAPALDTESIGSVAA